jgi:hypothetical protein
VQRRAFLDAVAMPPGTKPRLLHRVLGVRQGAEHAVTVEQELAAMRLDVASELVHNVLRSSSADRSASILTCNTGAGSKTHRAVAFGVFGNLSGPVISNGSLYHRSAKDWGHSLLKENELLHQGLSRMELASDIDR